MKLLLIIENKDLINYLTDLINRNEDDCLLSDDITKSHLLVKSYKPDWIIIDLNLIEINSYELAKRIKEEKPNINICILSDMLDKRLQKKAKSLGIECFLSKESLFEFHEIIRREEYQSEYSMDLKLKLLNKSILLSAISGILLSYSLITLNSFLIWFAFVPLLLALSEKKIKESIFYISVFTIPFGIISYFWIPATFQKFTGEFSFISILAISSFILGNLLLFILWIAAFNYLEIKDNKSPIKKAVLNTILISLIYFLIEFININSVKGIPWNKVSLKIALSSNVYFIQLASVIGSVGLSIIVISFNYLIAEFIKTKNKILLFIGIGVFVSNLLLGFIMVHGSDESNNKKNVALVCENVKAETKWTEHGDAIISKMLSLIKESKKYNTELIIWPETALPWTYIENDDIIMAIAEILKGSNTQNLIGYLTQSEKDSNLVYNSAYLIDKDGKAIGRYDKRILLDFIESPFLSDNNSLLPMLVQSLYDYVLPGTQSNILTTNIGKCKVEICNESLMPDYFNTDENSFEFIVNMSNDAWFESNQNIEHHFHLSSLKAVEYGKYMVINSNRGISGIVNDKGMIQVSSKSDIPQKIIAYIVPNSNKTLYTRFPLAVPLLSFMILILFTTHKEFIKRK